MVEQIAEKTLDSKPPTSLWMRSISFAGLLRILHLIAEYPDGLTVNKLNAEIRKRKAYLIEPAASGAPLGDDLWLPESWKKRLQGLFNSLEDSRGVKAIAISGEYGSGKSYVLQWLNRQELPNRRVKPFSDR